MSYYHLQISTNPDNQWWDFDLDHQTLMGRYVDRYLKGLPMPAFGQWVYPTHSVAVRIFTTSEPIGQLDNREKEQRMAGREVTLDFITGRLIVDQTLMTQRSLQP